MLTVVSEINTTSHMVCNTPPDWIITRYGLDGSGFEFRKGLGVFSKTVHTVSGAQTRPIQWVTGFFTLIYICTYYCMKISYG
jgi:hypothetical protein